MGVFWPQEDLKCLVPLHQRGSEKCGSNGERLLRVLSQKELISQQVSASIPTSYTF